MGRRSWKRALFALLTVLNASVLAAGVLNTSQTWVDARPTTDPQGGGFPPPSGGGPTLVPGDPYTHSVSMPDTSAQVGETFEMPMSVVTHGEIFGLWIQCSVDSDKLNFTGFSLGDSMVAYIDILPEPPPCDVIIYPESMAILMIFVEPFDSEVYGSDLFVIEATAQSADPIETFITILTDTGQSHVTEVHIVEELPYIQRGDVNSDGVCDLTDAISLIDNLFLQPSIRSDCADACDIDDDGQVVITDAVLLLSGIFDIGDVPMPEGCARDRTLDVLPDCGATACP